MTMVMGLAIERFALEMSICSSSSQTLGNDSERDQIDSKNKFESNFCPKIFSGGFVERKSKVQIVHFYCSNVRAFYAIKMAFSPYFNVLQCTYIGTFYNRICVSDKRVKVKLIAKTLSNACPRSVSHVLVIGQANYQPMGLIKSLLNFNFG